MALASARPQLLRVASLCALLVSACKDPVVVRTDVDLSVVPERDLSMPPRIDMAVGPCGVCVAPTPLCDVRTKKCVACFADDDCPELTLCKAGACVPGCTAQSRCGDAGSCDVDLGRCRGCVSDSECRTQGLPVCDVGSGRCVACSLQSDQCPVGTYCVAQNGGVACVPGCKGDPDCQFDADGGGASSRCCGHVCVDSNSSPLHCGGCGIDCKGGTCCGGACANTQTDLKNCGGCGKQCVGKNSVPACVGGACVLGACVMGFADCNKDAADGCETNVTGDASNCGGCGVVCNIPNANALCLGGQCVNGGCKPGFRDCDGNPANGCEINVAVDLKNCGVCGQSCAALPHATAGCANGACVVSACDAGFGNCDKLDNNGCEAPLSADPKNCGACGKACPSPPNVATSCVNQVCMTGGCAAGYADCNNNLNDGCEVKLGTDPKNCGACGNACAAPANATAGCTGGVCGVGQCVAPFLDCDGNAGNGCETNGSNDNNNCGKCANVCPNGTPCAAGQCGCVPNGGRVAFNNLQSKTASGCWQGNPCAYDQYNWNNTQGINFQAFGQQVTCAGAGAACVAHVGITTYQGGASSVCQGIWDVYCDKDKVGSINTLGIQCIGSAQNNGCNISFSARSCTTIQIVAASDNDNTSNCCAGMSPDSMVTGISAW